MVVGAIEMRRRGALVVFGVAMIILGTRDGSQALQVTTLAQRPRSTIEQLQAKLMAAKNMERKFQGLELAAKQAQDKYTKIKAEHDQARHQLSKQEMMLGHVIEEENKMNVAKQNGKVQAFNHALTGLNSGMIQLTKSLSAAECPPTHGGQAALNMCMMKAQFGHAEVLKVVNKKALAALRTALDSSQQTG
jgi:hypothetical protein